MSDYIQIFDPPGQTRDCIHGQHARKCPICELERELHGAKERLTRCAEEKAFAVTSRDQWKQCAEGLAGRLEGYKGTRFWSGHDEKALSRYIEMKGK